MTTADAFAAEVARIRDQLDIDDQFNEGRRRDNTGAAIELARRTHNPEPGGEAA